MVTGGTLVSAFNGVNTGQGGMILDANFDYGHGTGNNTFSYNNGSTVTTQNLTSGPIPAGTYHGFDGDWSQNFANPVGQGNVNVFVPEPVAYAWMTGALCLGFAFVRRKPAALTTALI